MGASTLYKIWAIICLVLIKGGYNLEVKEGLQNSDNEGAKESKICAAAAADQNESDFKEDGKRWMSTDEVKTKDKNTPTNNIIHKLSVDNKSQAPNKVMDNNTLVSNSDPQRSGQKTRCDKLPKPAGPQSPLNTKSVASLGDLKRENKVFMKEITDYEDRDLKLLKLLYEGLNSKDGGANDVEPLVKTLKDIADSKIALNMITRSNISGKPVSMKVEEEEDSGGQMKFAEELFTKMKEYKDKLQDKKIIRNNFGSSPLNPELINPKAEPLYPAISSLLPAQQRHGYPKILSMDKKDCPALSMDKKDYPALSMDKKDYPALSMDKKDCPALSMDKKDYPALSMDKKDCPALSTSLPTKPVDPTNTSLSTDVSSNVTEKSIDDYFVFIKLIDKVLGNMNENDTETSKLLHDLNRKLLGTNKELGSYKTLEDMVREFGKGIAEIKASHKIDDGGGKNIEESIRNAREIKNTRDKCVENSLRNEKKRTQSTCCSAPKHPSRIRSRSDKLRHLKMVASELKYKIDDLLQNLGGTIKVAEEEEDEDDEDDDDDYNDYESLIRGSNSAKERKFKAYEQKGRLNKVTGKNPVTVSNRYRYFEDRNKNVKPRRDKRKDDCDEFHDKYDIYNFKLSRKKNGDRVDSERNRTQDLQFNYNFAYIDPVHTNQVCKEYPIITDNNFNVFRVANEFKKVHQDMIHKGMESSPRVSGFQKYFGNYLRGREYDIRKSFYLPSRSKSAKMKNKKKMRISYGSEDPTSNDSEDPTSNDSEFYNKNNTDIPLELDYKTLK